MDKFVGILRINPSPLAREHDIKGHGNKEIEYLSYDFIKYNTDMKLAGQKYQREERHVLLKDSMDTVFSSEN